MFSILRFFSSREVARMPKPPLSDWLSLSKDRKISGASEPLLPRYKRSERQINLYNKFFNPNAAEYEGVAGTGNPFSLEAFSNEYLRVGITPRSPEDWEPGTGILTISNPQVFQCRRTVYSPTGVLYDQTLRPIREALNTYTDIDHVLERQPENISCFEKAWFSDSIIVRKLQHMQYLIQRRHRIPPLQYVNKPLLLFFDHYHFNFTHFLVEAFPRLFALREQLPHLIPIMPARVADLSKPEYSCIMACLQSLGITPDSCICLQDKSYYAFEHLTLPSQLKMHPRYVVPAIQHLCNFYEGASGTETSERIYITREHATGRKLQNEEAIMKVLLRHGFQKVVMENLSFGEKVRVMRRARVLVCSDGSSVTNAVFMSPNARVLAFRPCEFPNYHVVLMALFGHLLQYQLCPFATTNQSWYTGDLHVDIPTLEANLEKLLPEVAANKM